MTTPEARASAVDTAAHALSADLSVAWFVKRSALWLTIVALGVGAACLLYAAAGSAETRDELPVALSTPG